MLGMFLLVLNAAFLLRSPLLGVMNRVIGAYNTCSFLIQTAHHTLESEINIPNSDFLPTFLFYLFNIIFFFFAFMFMFMCMILTF